MICSRRDEGHMAEDRPAQVTKPARLRGRQAQAAHNDALILQAAREVFLADPTAPISAVAERAGGGSGALYHRYASKEDLLRTLCRAGQEIYLAEIRRALASGDAPWEAWTGFLRRIVAADTHGLTVRLAGTFAPSAEQFGLAEEMRSLAIELFERVRGTGLIRDDVTFLDVEFLLEFLAGIKLGDTARSAELRQRHLAVIIDGLRSAQGAATGERAHVPGQPPTWEEQTGRWRTR